MVHDRCWTAARRKQHNLQDDDSCTACLQLPETIPHILIECVFAREIWTILFNKWNWFRLAAQLAVHEEFIDWWQWSRKEMHRDDRKTFDTLVVLVAWLLWKERNNLTFQGINLTARDMVLKILEERKAWASAGFTHLLKLFPKVASFRSQSHFNVIA